MSRYYRRTTPDIGENLKAGLVALGLGAGVAAASFYLVRLFLAREPLEPVPRTTIDGERAGDPFPPALPEGGTDPANRAVRGPAGAASPQGMGGPPNPEVRI
jgi:hypothetical protein